MTALAGRRLGDPLAHGLAMIAFKPQLGLLLMAGPAADLVEVFGMRDLNDVGMTARAEVLSVNGLRKLFRIDKWRGGRIAMAGETRVIIEFIGRFSGSGLDNLRCRGRYTKEH